MDTLYHTPLAGAPRLLRIDRAMALALKPISTPSYLIEHEVEVGKTGPAKTGPAGPAAPALLYVGLSSTSDGGGQGVHSEGPGTKHNNIVRSK